LVIESSRLYGVGYLIKYAKGQKPEAAIFFKASQFLHGKEVCKVSNNETNNKTK
jgi:hypothetical protein